MALGLKIKPFISLVGAAAGDLDSYLVASLTDGDMAFGIVSGLQHTYEYDASLSIGANNSPYQIIPDDNVSGTGAWVLAGSIGWFDRGDIASVDFQVGDLTTDLTWRNLDLSSIVPTGTKRVTIGLQITDDAAGSFFQFRKDGYTDVKNVYNLRTQVGAIINDGYFDVPCSTNRVIEYRGANLAFNAIDITILGWYI